MVKIKKGISNTQIILIAVVAVFVGWGLIYFATKNAKAPTTPTSQEISEAVEEAFTAAQEQGRADFVEEEIEAYKVMLGQVSEFLSDAGKTNAELVLNFVQENPTVLYDTSIDVPQDVKDAYRQLSQEVEQIKQSVGYTDRSNESDQEQVVELTGVLEVSDLSDQGVGTMFKLTDENDGYNYYFLLNSSETERMFSENLVGNVVIVQVEVTNRVNGGVLYKVLNGPNLVE